MFSNFKNLIFKNKDNKRELCKLVEDKEFDNMNMPVIDKIYALIYLCGYVDSHYIDSSRTMKISKDLLTSKTSDTFFCLCACNWETHIKFVPENFHNIVLSHAKYTWGYNIRKDKLIAVLNDPRVFMSISSSNHKILMQDIENYIDNGLVTNIDVVRCFNIINKRSQYREIGLGFNTYHEKIIYSRILKIMNLL